MVKMGRRKFMQVMDPTLAKQILLTDADCFKKSYLQDRLLKSAVGDGLLTTEGAVWRQQRRAASPAFRLEALKNLVPSMQEAANDAVLRVQNELAHSTSAKPVDIHEQMVKTTYDIIEATLLSGDSEDPDYPPSAIADDIAEYLETVGKFNLMDLLDAPDWIPRSFGNPRIVNGQKAIKRLRSFAARQIADRKKKSEPGDDLLGLMISASDPQTGKGLTDLQLLDNLITFIGAGHETTALALTWSLSILSQQPDLQEKLLIEVKTTCGDAPISAAKLDELKLHEQVILEAMRLYPPVSAIPRSVIEPVKIGNVALEPGDHVTIAVYPLHRHNFLWDDPDTFDPDRFSEEKNKSRDRYLYLPFGAGPRICIGMKFALMEAVTILGELVRKYKFSPDPDHEIIPTLNVTLRPKNGMPLYVETR